MLREVAVRYAAELGWGVYPDQWVRVLTTGQIVLWRERCPDVEPPAYVCSCPKWMYEDEKRGWLLCDSPGKHPFAKLAPNGPLSASHAPKTIRAWWGEFPNCNIGIATGLKSGVWVLDIDVKSGGHLALARMLAAFGCEEAKSHTTDRTYTADELDALYLMALSFFGTCGARTGGGGLHIFFRWQSPVKGKNVTGAFDSMGYPGIDIRSDGGHVVAAPSLHVSGRRYEWLVEPWGAPVWKTTAYSHLASPEERVEGSLKLAPAWLMEMIESPLCGKRKGQDSRIGGLEDSGGSGYVAPEFVPWGSQDFECTRYAGYLRALGWEKPAIVDALVTFVAERCQQPSKSRKDCERIAKSICKKPAGTAVDRPPPVGELPVPAEKLAEIRAAAPKREPRGGSREYKKVVSGEVSPSETLAVGGAEGELPVTGDRITGDGDGEGACESPALLGGEQLLALIGDTHTPTEPPAGEPPGPGDPPPWLTIEEPEPPRSFPLTEYGMAERLLHASGGDLRYCHLFGKWLVWEGHRWIADETGGTPVQQKLIHVVRDLKEEGKRLQKRAGKATMGEAMEEWAKKCESAARFAAIPKLARGLPGVPVTPDDLDADIWLLGVKNGVVDLRSGELRPGRREDLMTKQAGCAYDASALCPNFEKFFWWAMGNDRELAQFVLLGLGYSLTGAISNQVFFFLHGSGGNGKGTLSGLMGSLMGDYGATLRKECLMAKNHIEIPNDIAALRGKRMVWVHEVQEKAFDEALLKTLTGSDKIQARFFREEWFEFLPTFKLWITGNVRPDIKQFDPAMSRRLREIPFDAVYETQKDMTALLESELPGVLTLLVRFCRAWQVGKLTMPERVLRANQEYKEYSDRIGRFLADCCDVILGDDGKPALNIEIGGQELYDSYRAWVKRTGESFTFEMRKFGESMKLRVPHRRASSGMKYQGLQLKFIPTGGGDAG